ncbi:hypothetical protein D1872_89700 [compost metagenome]
MKKSIKKEPKESNVITIRTFTSNGDAVPNGTVRYEQAHDGMWRGSNGALLSRASMNDLVERAEKREDQEVIKTVLEG